MIQALPHTGTGRGPIAVAPGKMLYNGTGMGCDRNRQRHDLVGCAEHRREPRRAGGAQGPSDHHVPQVRVDAWSRALPKGHSQLHQKADPTLIHFLWEALPSGTDENGSAAHTGHGVPGCPSVKLTGMGSHGIWIHQWGMEPGQADLRLGSAHPANPCQPHPPGGQYRETGIYSMYSPLLSKKREKSFTGTRMS